MKATLDEFTDKLYMNHKLSAYETYPWSHYDEASGITCNAEVRMSGDEEEMEAEIQVVRERPDDTEKAMVQIFYMRIIPYQKGQFQISALRIMGEDHMNGKYGWGEKGCKFFKLSVRCLEDGQLPDFDEIFEEAMNEDGMFGDRVGEGGGKSPHIKMHQLLDMKQGGF